MHSHNCTRHNKHIHAHTHKHGQTSRARCTCVVFLFLSFRPFSATFHFTYFVRTSRKHTTTDEIIISASFFRTHTCTLAYRPTRLLTHYLYLYLYWLYFSLLACVRLNFCLFRMYFEYERPQQQLHTAAYTVI